MDQVPANEETKDQLENQAVYLLGNSDSSTVTAIATKKYLTADNQFVYLTRSTITTDTIPSLKWQVFRRVDGGVVETGYLLYHDHRFERYENPMIFGQNDANQTTANSPVSQAEAEQLMQLLTGLGPHNQKI
jgi:hypothetical protein